VVVSIVVHQLDRSGGSRVLVRSANALAVAGHSVTIVVPHGRWLETYRIEPRVRVVPAGVGLLRGGGPASTLLRTGLMWSSIPKADVVVFSYFLCAVPVRVQYLLGVNRRILYFVQENEPLAFGTLADRLSGLRRTIASWSLKPRYAFIANSRYVSAFLADEYGHTAPVVSPGVDRSIFRPEPADDGHTGLSVGIIGRRTRAKGWPMLLETLRCLAGLRNDVRFVVIAPERYPELGAFGERLIWVPPAGDRGFAQALRAVTVFFSSSLVEGFGLPVLESMAVGTPVVATDSMGLRDFLKDGENGVLVPFGDATSAARAISDLLDDGQRRAVYRKRGLEMAAEFSWERFDRQLVTAVEAVGEMDD